MKSYCAKCDRFLVGRHFNGRICGECRGATGAALRDRGMLDGPISLPTDLRNARLELCE